MIGIGTGGRGGWLVVTFIVELAPELTVDGVKEAEDPVGRPVALRATDWATPLVTAVLIVVEAESRPPRIPRSVRPRSRSHWVVAILR